MKLLLQVVGIVVLVTAGVRGQSIDECLQKDSISCVQKTLFRKAKEFFGRESFELVNGVSLVKAKAEGRGARSGKDLVYEQEVEKAAGVAERQSALENFVGEEVSEFLTGRSLKINFAPVFQKIGESARAVSGSIPAEVKQAVDEVVEGRGKKKLLKTIIPLLLAVKVKIGALATLAYFGIALLAKKAILASIISIAISAFIGLKALWAHKHALHHDTTGYSAGWSSGVGAGWPAPVASSGWSSGGSGWEDTHGAYSAQNQAYSGYHRK
ncbi:hypothetical protein TSAR_010530 [Trichomalopsis sarcophagae]|uniref:Osiris 6 n=1 Tax=Trichomalopsis sarcophagae TaxID=543379 RepID=A0A232EVP3_9HYME|nr:hypothetical protein TSAR_010530 [Trichomalopsis sarcophagae]